MAEESRKARSRTLEAAHRVSSAGDGPERALARALVWALPLGTVVVALGVGVAFDVASAFLVLVTGALLGAILLLWFSLRTLAGDVPADPSLEATGTAALPRTELDERKRRALRSLKDLEQEHAIGKIDEEDYKKLLVEYRSQAKAVIREMDDTIAPHRAEAEELVREHLKKHHIEPASEKAEVSAPAAEDLERVVCPSCETANDTDATFCKKCGARLAEEEDANTEEADGEEEDEGEETEGAS